MSDPTATTTVDAAAVPHAPLRGGEPLLRVEGLVKHFPLTQGLLFRKHVGDVKAVDDVSFDLRRGETLGIVGESGSGKSVSALAIMRLLPRLTGRTRGSIRFDQRDLTRLAPYQRARCGLGYVPQGREIFGRLMSGRPGAGPPSWCVRWR